MRSLFFRICIFLLPVAAVFLILEFLLRQIPNDYILKKEYLDKNSDSIQVLILGSSHSLHGLNPVYLKLKSFNAANYSQSLDYDLEILRKYKNHWSKLEYVILPVSYPSLFEKIEDSLEGWRVKNYVIYFKIRISKHLPYYTEIMNGSLLEHIRRLFNFYYKTRDDVRCTSLGWPDFYTPGTSKDLITTGIESAKRNTIPADKQHVDEMRSALDSIIQIVKGNNSRLILLTPPAYASFRENLNSDQWDSSLSIINRIVRSGSNCSYFNLIDDKSFKAEDFYDGDHLNTRGAEKLTLMLDSIINGNN